MLKLDPNLHLIHLLFISATVVDENKIVVACDNLAELYNSVSLIDDSIQLATAYFANSLAARLYTKRSPFYHMIMKKPTPEEDLFAFTKLYYASPYCLRIFNYGRSLRGSLLIGSYLRESTNMDRWLNEIG
ncbi:hypothetical protein ACLOJK_000176 [Asimina triloba]